MRVTRSAIENYALRVHVQASADSHWDNRCIGAGGKHYAEHRAGEQGQSCQRPWAWPRKSAPRPESAKGSNSRLVLCIARADWEGRELVVGAARCGREPLLCWVSQLAPRPAVRQTSTSPLGSGCRSHCGAHGVGSTGFCCHDRVASSQVSGSTSLAKALHSIDVAGLRGALAEHASPSRCSIHNADATQ